MQSSVWEIVTALRRLLTHTVETALSKKIIAGDVCGGDTVELGFDGQEFTFKTL